MANQAKHPAKKTPSPKKDQRKGILIVGDWFVDEHWVTGHHRSRTASRKGRVHQRSLHKPQSAVQSLCGAGRTASVLHQAQDQDRRLFDIYGIGMWHVEDTTFLAQMLAPSSHTGHTPFHIRRDPPKDSPSGQLYSLSSMPVLAKEEHGTEHVIRTYRRHGKGFEVSERIDWILRPTRGGIPVEEWLPDHEEMEDCTIPRDFVDPKHIAAVVIKDHGRGVVSAPLIRWLKSFLAQTPWFVSTKAWAPAASPQDGGIDSPHWLTELSDVDLRVLLIPQVPAHAAIQAGRLACWLTPSGWVTKETFDLMDSLHATYFKASSQSLAIVLPQGSSLIAREQSPDKKLCGLIQLHADLQKTPAPVPMASVFLPALVGYLLHTSLPTSEILKRSLSFTHTWMNHEAKRIEEPEGWDPVEPALTPNADETPESIGKWDTLDNWEGATQEWKQAYGMVEHPNGGWGIISSGSDRRIELWRAMTDLEGYVCVVESKRRAVRKIINTFARFCHDEPTEHVSCMVISEPGAGKTCLARQLSAALKMRYRVFNIAQMLSKEDLVQCFDKIATVAQSLDHDERLLVFIDEINAHIRGESVYGSFLAPLEDRVFIHHGQPHPIPPCAWLFAGTKNPREEPPEAKGPDFYSRLTVKPIELCVEKHEGDRARLENMYLGMCLIQAAYPDVRHVSEKIVRMFHGIPPLSGRMESEGTSPETSVHVRDIEQFVRALDEVQYGQVRARNVRADILEEFGKKFCIDPVAWSNEEDGPLVRIVR